MPRPLFFLALILTLHCLPAPALEIRSPGRFDHQTRRVLEHRAALAVNDDADCGLVYQPGWNWPCAANCPGDVCDHRALEPVRDNMYVGGPVEAEDDLLELEVVAPPALPAGARIVLTVTSGGEAVRFWPGPKKGAKTEILAADAAGGISFTAGAANRIYVEGIAPGSAQLHLAVEGGGAYPPFVLHVDVVRLVDSVRKKREFIYGPAEIDLHIEPRETMQLPAYRGRFAWDGGASGRGPRATARFDPGRGEEARRAVYHPTAVIDGRLALTGTVRVAQSEYTGTRTPWSVPERRRLVEELAPLPPHSFMDTAQPDTPDTRYSQSWFAANFTGASTDRDPVKPVNSARLQYAPAFDSARDTMGIACCYDAPVAAFITDRAFSSGLKLEDLRALAGHELRHLRQYAGTNTIGDVWQRLCSGLPHEVASYFMEADAYAVTLASDASWRYLRENSANFSRNYLLALAELQRLPTRSHVEAGVEILKEIYNRLPAELDCFKRPENDFAVRPPLEVEEIMTLRQAAGLFD